jgi:hypothetical protein
MVVEAAEHYNEQVLLVVMEAVLVGQITQGLLIMVVPVTMEVMLEVTALLIHIMLEVVVVTALLVLLAEHLLAVME